jgi:alpha-L-arabinofuranosidase
MNFSGAPEVTFAVQDFAVTGGRVLEIAPDNPRQEVSPLNPDVFKPRERALEGVKWRFPARSVSVVELECRAA